VRDKAPAMMREAMNQTNKPTTAATESLGTSYGWDQRCRNAEQAAHIGTYALPALGGQTAHIAGYALAGSDELLQDASRIPVP